METQYKRHINNRNNKKKNDCKRKNVHIGEINLEKECYF